MFAAKHERATYRGRDPRWWPLLLLLLAVVLLPTACLLWMMSKAIDNERLAVRQVLADACREQLCRLQKDLDGHWRAKAAKLDRLATELQPQLCFATVVSGHLADSAICCNKFGQPSYPTVASSAVEPPEESPAWARASELEFTPAKTPADQPARFRLAAQAFAALAANASDINLAARAYQAQARCLAKAGRNREAIDVLTGPLAEKRFQHAVDPAGRLIVADAELRALQLFHDVASPSLGEKLDKTDASLDFRLGFYLDPLPRSPQRLFLMHAVQHLHPYFGTTHFPTLPAEELAAEFLAAGAPIDAKPVLHSAGLPGVWQFGSTKGRIVMLFRDKTILQELDKLAAEEKLPSGARVQLLPPNQTPDMSKFLHVLPAGDRLPGWQLGLTWNDEQLVNATARGKIAAYMLTGLLAVAIAAGLALWIAITFRRQMRLTRLKNDLVATVSHELKTPLTSIRLLVDTLLSGTCGAGVSPAEAAVLPASAAGTAAPQNDPKQVREYLELIAKENARLSRLIDNFLTFSRMERNKRAFSFSPIAPAAIVASAADAVRERFQQAGCRFDAQVEPGLPPVNADADAMTTALVNLLDNAWKYTEADKQIALRAYGDGGRVSFAVCDNGIGLSRAACKKVFERFYQVDRELSRSRGGCGLGLSIVEFIVKGHGGDVTVRSRPGQGSTFTITLPRGETD